MKWTKQEKIMFLGKTGTIMINFCLSTSSNFQIMLKILSRPVYKLNTAEDRFLYHETTWKVDVEQFISK